MVRKCWKRQFKPDDYTQLTVYLVTLGDGTEAFCDLYRLK